MNKKKVLMIHNFYQIGGGEHTVYKNELEMLRKYDHEVIEYTRNNDELKNSIIKMVLLPFTTLWSFKTYFEVKRIIKENEIDIVHCHNVFPLISPSVYYAATKLDIPVVQTIHNFRLLCPKGIYYRKGKICEECTKKDSFKSALKYKCYRNSRIQTLVVLLMLKIHRKLGTYKKINYIFLTEFNKEKFRKLIDISGKNMFIKPNFVKEPSNMKKKYINKKIFVFSGRLEENKGILSLIKMWEKLPKDYILHIYGTGNYENYVKQIANDTTNIKYYGFQPQDVMFQDISESVAVIIASECYETFGMLIPESFSLSTPVLCTNLGNPKMLVEESKGGLTYETACYDSFYKSLNEIIKNNAYYAKNAFVYYKEELSDGINYEKLSDIYDKAKTI